MVEGITIVFFSILITVIIVILFIKGVKIMFDNIPAPMDRHNHYDYYDEPDGFYVTMPNGDVRID